MIAVAGSAWNARATDEQSRSGGFDPFAAAAVLQAQPVAMLITDPRRDDNPIVFANEAAVALTGYPAGELLGRNCRILVGAETDPAALDRIRAMMTAAEPLEIEIRLHRKDGTGCWYRLLLAPVRGEDGLLEYFILNLIDLTIERDCIEALESHNRVLTMMGEGLARQNRELTRGYTVLKRQIEGTDPEPAEPRSTH